MTDLTAADLARWEALAEAATPGPWAVQHVDDAYAMNATYVGTGAGAGADLLAGRAAYGQVIAITLLQEPRLACHESARWDEDAAFIVAARAAVPALVALVRDLARALVATETQAYPDSRCPICAGAAHDPDCAVLRARALLGDEEEHR